MDQDGGTTEIDLFLSYSTLFGFPDFKALVMLSWYHEEEKIHVFKELDSPALSLWFLFSLPEKQNRDGYTIY